MVLRQLTSIVKKQEGGQRLIGNDALGGGQIRAGGDGSLAVTSALAWCTVML